MSWLSGFSTRKKIVIDHTKVNSDLTHFPVTVFLGSGDAEVFGEISYTDRKKIAFTKEDGITELYAEIERYNTTNLKAVYHVSKSDWVISSSKDTIFYMYFDSSHAENTSYIDDSGGTVAQNVWDSNFVAVYHLNQDPTGGTGCILDSTSNNDDGTPHGSMTSDDLVDGKVGKALDFDGSNDYIEFSTSLAVTSIVTVEALMETSSSAGMFIVDKYKGGVKGFYLSGNKIGVSIGGRDGSGSFRSCGTVGTYDFSSGGYLVGTIDKNLWKIYANGTLDNSIDTGYTSTDLTSDTHLNIGYFGTDNNKYFDGIIDEVRISNVVRSDAWIKATYYSLRGELAVVKGRRVGWLSGFEYRKKITVDHTKVSSDLIHFPVAVFLNSNDPDVFSYLSYSDRKKIAFTMDDGLTELYGEISVYDSTNKKAVYYVSSPDWVISSSKDTIFYMYFDSSHEENTSYIGDIGDSAAQNVWDSDFEGVWHLNQDPTGGSGCIKDSTSSGRNYTPQGSMTAGDLVDAKVDKGFDFDGSNDYLRGSDWFYSNELTVETVFKTDVLDASKIVAVKRNIGTSGNANEWGFSIGSDRKLSFIAWGSSGLSFSASSTSLISSTTSYYYGAGRCNGSNACIFLNDEKGSADTQDYTIQNTTSEIQIAALANDTTSRYFDGIIDEFRISSFARSDAWIKATYYSLWDELVTVGKMSWLPGWTRRERFSISSSYLDSNLTHFPVAIHLDSESGIFDELQYTGSYNDDYTGTNGDPPNSTLWQQIETTNTTVEIQSNKLQIACTSSADNESAKAKSKYVFVGDFDIQIDFTITTLSHNGEGLELFAILDTDNLVFIKAARVDNDDKFQVRFKIDGTIYDTNTISRSNTYGKLRIVRSGNTVTTKYQDGSGSWTDAVQRTDLPSGKMWVQTSLWTGPSGNAITATVDNFTINSSDGQEWRYGYHPNAKKLAVTKDDGITQLYVEIDHYDDYSKKAVLWVSKSDFVISGSEDTALYLYYDKNESDNTSYVGYAGDTPAESVWDDDFVLVQHFSEDPENTLHDSTSNSNDGTQNGGIKSKNYVSSLCGTGLKLDGVDDYINFGNNSVLNLTNTLTIEALFNPTDTLTPTFTTWGIVCKQHIPTSGEDSYTFFLNAEGKIHLGTQGGNIQGQARTWSGGTDYYAAGTYASGTLSGDLFFNDSKEVLTVDNYDTMAGTSNDLVVGVNQLTNDEFMKGIIDEVRISKVVRSDAWIKATNAALRGDLVSKAAWLSEFSHRVSITINHSLVDSDLTEFPLAIHLSTESGVTNEDLSTLFSEVGEHKKRICVTKSDGITKLHTVVQKWDTITKEAWLTVGADLSSSVDSILYLYFDNFAPDQDYLSDITEANDDFNGTNGDPPNTTKWWVEAGSPEIQSNNLAMSVSSGSRDRVVSKFQIEGDFDIETTCHINSTPNTHWWLQELLLYFPDDSNHWCYIGRGYNNDQGTQMVRSRYNKGTSTTLDWDSLTATDYSLRIVREDDTIYFYYKTTGDWIGLSNVAMHNSRVKVTLMLDSGSDDPSVSGYYSSFTINSAERITGWTGRSGQMSGAGVYDKDTIVSLPMTNAMDIDTLFIRGNSNGDQGLTTDGKYFYWGHSLGTGVDGRIYKMTYNGTDVTNFAGPAHCAGGAYRSDRGTLLFCSGGSDDYEVWEISKTGTKLRSWDLHTLDYGINGLVAYAGNGQIYMFTADASNNFTVRLVTLNDNETYTDSGEYWSHTDIGTPQGLCFANGRLLYLADYDSKLTIWELMLRSSHGINPIEYGTDIASEGEGLTYDGDYFYMGRYSVHRIYKVEDLSDLHNLKYGPDYLRDETKYQRVLSRAGTNKPVAISTSFAFSRVFEGP